MDFIATLTEEVGAFTISANAIEEKKNSFDIMLWKKGEPGEPAYHSPWGLGRSGGQIQYAAMAYAVLGGPYDIRTSPLHLKYHYDAMKIAVCAAHENNHCCVGYYIHIADLTINVEKTSLSSKKMITITEAIDIYDNDDSILCRLLK